MQGAVFFFLNTKKKPLHFQGLVILNNQANLLKVLYSANTHRFYLASGSENSEIAKKTQK